MTYDLVPIGAGCSGLGHGCVEGRAIKKISGRAGSLRSTNPPA